MSRFGTAYRGSVGPVYFMQEVDDLASITAKLDALEERQRPFIQTHGPWQILTEECLKCGKRAIEIHALKLRCK